MYLGQTLRQRQSVPEHVGGLSQRLSFIYIYEYEMGNRFFLRAFQPGLESIKFRHYWGKLKRFNKFTHCNANNDFGIRVVTKQQTVKYRY